MTSILPYWDRNVEFNIEPWFPYAKDYSPVTVNKLLCPLLESVAGLAFEMHSEFLFLRSFQRGNVGTLARQNMIDPIRNSGLELGFTTVFTYSEEMENCIVNILHKFEGLRAGLTLCGIWSGQLLVDECKVIMLVSEDPFFDEDTFFQTLEKSFQILSGKDKSNISFFAEKFGYRRFSISYETDNVTDMRITQALFDLELDSTREVIGPLPELKLPHILGRGSI